MAQTIKLKRSNTAGNLPTTTDLALGEVAINTKDGKFFIRKHVDGTDSGDAITMYAPQGLNTYGTQVLEVKVITKTTAHPQYGTGSASGYSIDGLESPFITLIPGNTYKFDQADSSNTGHPLRFYLEEDKTTSYTTGVTSSGTPGSASAYTEIVVSTDTPQVLYYQCSSHAYMGSGAYALSDAIADGKVDTDQLAANAVTSAKIAANAITSSELAADSVGSSEIAANAVGSTEIAANAVSTSEIASNAITSALIAANSVSTSEIASNAITSALIAANAIGSSELASSGVTAASYGSSSAVPVITVDADGRITSASTASISGLAANAVTATEIAKNAVGSSEIAANAVGSSEIASDAVGTDEIADNAVTAAKIAKNAVGSSEIASNSVGIDELNVSDGTSGQVLTTNGSGTLSFSTVSSSSQNLFETIAVSGQSDIVADSTTDTLTFAAGSGISLTTNASTDTLTITATGSGLSANAVTSAYIASNAVLARHIAANAVGSSEIAASGVTSGSYTNADITVDADGRITAASSGSAVIADNSITSAKIAANAVGSSELAASGVTSGTYGSATASPQLTVDADGRITSVSNVTISGSGGGGGVGLNQTISQYSASGDGSTLAFNTSITLSDENLTWVFIDGVYQQKNVYSVSGTTVTFGSGNAPPNGSTVEVMVLESITTGGAFGHNSFNGDGSTATFTLGQTPTAETDLIAFIDGVYQNQDSFTISGADITFDTAPANGTKVIVYVIGGVVTGKVQIVNNFSGDASTTAFTLTINPVSEENTNVYIDGVYQQKSEYSVSGTTLTFSSAPPSGTNNIEVVIGQVTTTTSMGANSVTSAAIAASAVGTSELAANAVTTAKMASNGVTSALIAANAVGSSEIAANAVTATQLGGNAVTATHIAADAVGSSEIADNAVGIDQLNVSDGTNGQVLSTNGSGTLSFTSKYTDSDVESYLNTSEIYTDPTNNYLGVGSGASTPSHVFHVQKSVASGTLVKLQNASNTASDVLLLNTGGTGSGTNILDVQASGSSKFLVRGDGNVGIGTSSPSAILDIRTAQNSTSQFTSPFIKLFPSSTTNTTGFTGITYGLSTLDNYGWSVGGLRRATSADVGAFVFNFHNNSASGSEKMRIDSSGDVGIGTSSPNHKLDVYSSERFPLRVHRTSSDLSSTQGVGIGLSIRGDTTTSTSDTRAAIMSQYNGDFYVAVDAGGNLNTTDPIDEAALFIEGSNKYVGIGTTSPQQLLHLAAGSVRVRLEDTDTNSYGEVVYNTASGGLILRSDDNAATGSSGSNIIFETDGSERMRIDSSGSIISQRSVAGSATNLYLVNTRDVDGDDVGINFGFVSNGTYAKGGIFFQRKTTAGRGTLYFCNDVVSDSGNASIADSKMHINQGGYTKHSNDGTYQAAEGNYHEYRQTANEQALRITATNASYSDSMLRVDTTRAANTSSGFIRSEANGALQFLVRGDGTIFAQNTTVQGISDVRTKQNITDSTDGLDVINSLRPVRFDFKEGFGNEKTNQLGFIAQEVETVFPDAVDVWGESDEEGNPYKSVGTTTLIPVLTKAIQEQQTIIEDLKARIETLESN